MSDLHRYGFAYGHPRCPLPYGKDDDPARAAFLDHLAALRRQGQRNSPTPEPEPYNASPRKEVSRPRAPRVRQITGPSGFSGRYCKVCSGPVPAMENGRKVRTDCNTCSPACRRKDAQRARDRRRSAKRAAARAAKAVAK